MHRMNPGGNRSAAPGWPVGPTSRGPRTRKEEVLDALGMSYGDDGIADAGAWRNGGRGRLGTGMPESHSGCDSTRSGGSQQNPFHIAFMRRGEDAFAARLGHKRLAGYLRRHDRFAEVLSADDTGSGLILHGCDADFDRSCGAVPLHS